MKISEIIFRILSYMYTFFLLWFCYKMFTRTYIDCVNEYIPMELKGVVIMKRYKRGNDKAILPNTWISPHLVVKGKGVTEIGMCTSDTVLYFYQHYDVGDSLIKYKGKRWFILVKKGTNIRDTVDPIYREIKRQVL